MSEYQYYEFRAVDRPLTDAQQRGLRAISSRGRITATGYSNTYEWGDFKGDPTVLMATMFDLHLHVANWGTRRFMVRVPASRVDRRALAPFLRGTRTATARPAGDSLVIDVVSEDEEGDEEWDDGTAWLGGLAPLRDALLGGDLRPFYLVWLTGVEDGKVGGDVPEPLPGGIGPLTGPLRTFADFLRLDPDLVAAAAEPEAGPTDTAPSRADVAAAIRALPQQDRVGLLLRLHDGDPHAGALLHRRVRAARPAPTRNARTAHALRARAVVIGGERLRVRQERDAAERKLREAEQAKARAGRLKTLGARGDAAWDDLEAEIERRNGPAYDRAAQTLFDLRDLAVANGGTARFAERLAALHGRHARKKGFLDRLAAGGLR